MAGDLELVAMLTQRDENAIAELDRAYGSYMRSIAYNVLKNVADSEECVNDELLRVWNSIPPAAPDNLKPYLKEITRNLAIDRYRLTHRKKDIPSESIVPLDELKDDPQDNSSGQAEAQDTEISELIAAFLRTQSERKIAVFVARYYHEETVEEIARTLSLHKNTVLSDLHRLRKGLAKFLEKEGVTI